MALTDQDMPGNDGRWFLELVGAAEPEPWSTSTFADLAADQARLDHSATVGVEASLDLDEDAVTSNGAPVVPMSDTDEFRVVSAAAIKSAADDPLEAWTPAELSPQLRSRRRIRWTLVALAVLAAGLIAAGFVLLPRVAEREAEATAVSYRESVVELRNVLPQTQAALGVLTDPTSSDADVGVVVSATADLEAASHEVNDLGSQPLPTTPPLVPRGPLDDLEPIRSEMAILGAEGQDVAMQISRGYIYRTTVPLLLATPPLPNEADTGTLNLLAGDLAASLADTVALIAQLPDGEPFVAVRATALEAAGRFGDWQLEYVNALRAEDVETVTALIGEIGETRADLFQLNTEALLVLRVEVDRQIIDLAGDLEILVAAIPT